jgi:hypothetical protein
LLHHKSASARCTARHEFDVGRLWAERALKPPQRGCDIDDDPGNLHPGITADRRRTARLQLVSRQPSPGDKVLY